jgi:hypothetical protein
MQGPTDYQTAFPDPLEMADFMATAYADAGKLYWKLWGPLGEPAIPGIDAWAEMQRAYLQDFRQSYGAGSQP